MRILFVSVEVAPYAKVGGLADVIGSLPKALLAQGHDVRIVMPDYGMIEADGHGPIDVRLAELPVHVNKNWTTTARVRELDHHGVPVYLLSNEEFFRDVDRSEAVYRPGIEQYLFFNVAALEMLPALGWQPDVIHCHDWHTGMAPVLMRERYSKAFADTASVYTIHNLAYQGEFDLGVLDALDLPHSLFNQHQVEAWGRVNFLKSGASFANRVNTVSPTYAQEILTPTYGATLDGLMRHLSDLGRLSGILNGLDQDVFNPSTDPLLVANFSADDLSGKAACKKALFKEIGMKPIPGAPLLGVVSRMSSQKGMDLIAETAEKMFKLPVQLVILGAGEPHIVDALTKLAADHPEHMRYFDGFDLPLGARIYSACDGFLMPSAFEPCGLGQMIARRYGALPLVRATGGLADTVIDGVDGYVFQNHSAKEFLRAVGRLASAFEDKKSWSKLIKHAMRMDAGWTASAKLYSDLYEVACEEQRVAKLQTA